MVSRRDRRKRSHSEQGRDSDHPPTAERSATKVDLQVGEYLFEDCALLLRKPPNELNTLDHPGHCALRESTPKWRQHDHELNLSEDLKLDLGRAKAEGWGSPDPRSRKSHAFWMLEEPCRVSVHQLVLTRRSQGSIYYYILGMTTARQLYLAALRRPMRAATTYQLPRPRPSAQSHFTELFVAKYSEYEN